LAFYKVFKVIAKQYRRVFRHLNSIYKKIPILGIFAKLINVLKSFFIFVFYYL
jgi:hypothetical protein